MSLLGSITSKLRWLRHCWRPVCGGLSRVVVVLSPALLLLPGWLFNPVTITLEGPRRAVLHSEVAGLELGLNVHWWDTYAKPGQETRRLAFDAQGTATLPTYTIRTSRVRGYWSRFITRNGLNPCEHCYGPYVSLGLYQTSTYAAPEKMRLTQNQSRDGGTVTFLVELIADEKQFEERPLEVEDMEALKSEVRELLRETNRVNIPAEAFGPELRRLNPVRAEIHRGSLLLWMGGKVGYTISPDSVGGPWVNGAWISGTDHPGVQRLEMTY